MYTLIHNDAEFLSYSKQRTTRTTSFAPKQVEKVNLRTKSVVHFKLLNRNSVGWLGFPLLTTVIDQSYRKIAIDVVNLKIQYRNFIIFTKLSFQRFTLKPGTDEQFFFDKLFLDKFYLFVCMGKVVNLISDTR